MITRLQFATGQRHRVPRRERNQLQSLERAIHLPRDFVRRPAQVRRPKATSSHTVKAMPDACVQGVGSTIPLRSRRATVPASRPPTTRGARSAATSRSVEAPAPSAPTSATTSPLDDFQRHVAQRRRRGGRIPETHVVEASGTSYEPRDDKPSHQRGETCQEKGPAGRPAPPRGRAAARAACAGSRERARGSRAPALARPPRAVPTARAATRARGALATGPRSHPARRGPGSVALPRCAARVP